VRHHCRHEQAISAGHDATCLARRGLVLQIEHAIGGDALVHGLNEHLNSVDGLGHVQNVDVWGRE
jgi:hypothetical protein